MDGSTIGVDTATHITDGEIYALEHDGMLRVKFVYRLPAAAFACAASAARNIRTRSTRRRTCSRQISMIGWVFWWSTVRHRRGPSLVR